MAITGFQRTVCRLIAQNRIEQGESYIAGGAALNTLIGAPRVSRDLDLFHDTREALIATWDADRVLLTVHGYFVEVKRERPTFVEALVGRDQDRVLMQWVCDSAYRFFPLVEHEDFGVTLHPFDLATNKLLAMVGRVEARDWVDIIACSREIQHIGYLAWAACGKDPGYNPAMILNEAKRGNRYSAAEIAQLSFEGPAPDAGSLSRQWSLLVAEAKEIIEILPPEQVGTCVLSASGNLLQGGAEAARSSLERDDLIFHAGSIRGAWPTILTAVAPEG